MHIRLLPLLAPIVIATLLGCSEPAHESCIPVCDGRTCGPDGCGGSCGPEDCGISCGICPQNAECNRNTGQCMAHAVRGSLSFEIMEADFDAIHLPRLTRKSVLPADKIPIALRDIDGRVLAQTTVAADGSFELSLRRLPRTTDWISITPLWYLANHLKVAVLRADQRTPWVWNIPLSSYVSQDDPCNVGDLRITTEQYSGALYLYQTLVKAFYALREYGFFVFLERLPGIAILWSPGKTWSCGSCIETTSVSVGSASLPYTLYISAGENDESAWGAPTLLHEFGHYVLRRHRDNAPGGAHAISSPSDPRLAWSEGWATFFALLMMSRQENRPVSQYWRVVSSGSYWIDYAHLYDAMGAGSVYITPPKISQDMKQNLSEAWITYMLWDFFDGKEIPDPSVPEDAIALGTAPIANALFSSRYKKLQHYDDGKSVKDSDFVDFLEALLCNEQNDTPDIVTQITELLQQRGFPYDGSPVCRPL